MAHIVIILVAPYFADANLVHGGRGRRGRSADGQSGRVPAVGIPPAPEAAVRRVGDFGPSPREGDAEQDGDEEHDDDGEDDEADGELAEAAVECLEVR